MNKYELTIVMDGKVTATKKKTVIQNIEKLVEDVKGKVGKVKDWGVKDLAYKIQKSETGLFLIFPLELEGAGAKEIANKLRLSEGVIRYLLIKI